VKTRIWLLALMFLSASIVGSALVGAKAFAQNPSQAAPSGAPQGERKERQHKQHKHHAHKHKRGHRENHREDKEKHGSSN
jgi:Ni/Co efflux regulator RcnB